MNATVQRLLRPKTQTLPPSLRRRQEELQADIEHAHALADEIRREMLPEVRATAKQEAEARAANDLEAAREEARIALEAAATASEAERAARAELEAARQLAAVPVEQQPVTSGPRSPGPIDIAIQRDPRSGRVAGMVSRDFTVDVTARDLNGRISNLRLTLA